MKLDSRFRRNDVKNLNIEFIVFNYKMVAADMTHIFQKFEKTKNISDENPKDWFCLDFLKLLNNGFIICHKLPVDVLITIRGMCMIDIFDMNDFQHAAFLDFDLSRPAALDSAFVSPFIGLPFNAMVHRTLGRTLTPFDDLRSNHHVGFFVSPDYRNRGAKGLWNLDELMMAIALETAFVLGHRLFTIKPTADKLEYYRKKFGARILTTTESYKMIGIDIETVRPYMRHIEYKIKENQISWICVKCSPDRNASINL
jgi:hypothetical protein